MTHVNDARRSALQTQTGLDKPIMDMELAYLQHHGATANNLTDAWREVLIGQGVTPGPINDMLFEWLGSLGATGSLSDRQRYFWETLQGAISSPPPPYNPPPPLPHTTNHNWVLHYGAWNDAGVWEDDETWIDVFTPYRLFLSSDEGVWFDGLDQSTLLTTVYDAQNPDTVGRTGDEVNRIIDKSGKGHNAVQDIYGRAPIWEEEVSIGNGNVVNAVFFHHIPPVSGAGVRCPIPSLPTRGYNVFMSLSLPSTQYFDSGGFQGLFAANSDGASMMLLLRSPNSRNFGTWGGGYQQSTADISQNAQGWSLVAMHDGNFRLNGQTAGTYTASQGQTAGIGGINGQFSYFVMADLVAIDRALTAFEMSLLENYMANKVNITLS